MKKFVCLLLYFCFVIKLLYAQTNRSNQYVNNIVDIAQDEFGFIIGAEKDQIYFILANQSSEPERTENLDVHFFGILKSYSATPIRTFLFGQSRLYLYMAVVDVKINWVPNKYDSYKNSSSPYYSFIDDRQPKKSWFVNSTPFQINNTISTQEIQLKTTKGNVFKRGMPIVDDKNSIVGIIAELQDETNQSIVLKTIDMQAIEEKFFSFSNCKYFQLLQQGQPTTRCKADQLAAIQQKSQIEKARRNNQLYRIMIGPTLTGLYTLASSNNAGGNMPGGFDGALGLTFTTAPDKGKVRFVMKPRITLSKLNVPSNLTPNSPIGFQVKSFNWHTYEVPLMAEFLFSRNQGGNTYWGLGYSPGYQDDVNYNYVTNKQSSKSASAGSTAGISQKFLANIGIEGSKIRFDFFIAYNFSTWHDSNTYNTYTIENQKVYPFEGISSKYGLFGIDLTYRLSGQWGLKSVK
ncbi:MAG: hypothetical protein EOP45_02635 [Sphingobacteriaceae bacterium]|nr:MAG: hypothetical protein EOP45_02635 [Sphingobacteriaceae bacterium]